MRNYKLPFFITLGVLALIVGFRLVYAASTNSVLLDPNSRPAKDGAACTVETSTKVVIGDDISTRVLASSTYRAWARISIGDMATNTISASFNQDAPAVVGQGVMLGLSGSGYQAGSTSTPNVDFGLTTQFPYTGSVTAITDNGTTTAVVTECNY